MRTLFFLKLKLRFLAQQKTRNGVFRPPQGSWIAPLGIQIDLRVSADAMDVINDLQRSARPQAVVDKKTEYVLLKKRSEILVPLLFRFSKDLFFLLYSLKIQDRHQNLKFRAIFVSGIRSISVLSLLYWQQSGTFLMALHK